MDYLSDSSSDCSMVDVHVFSMPSCACSSGAQSPFPGIFPASLITLPSASYSARLAVATFSSTACCWSTLPRWTRHQRQMELERKRNRQSQPHDGTSRDNGTSFPAFPASCFGCQCSLLRPRPCSSSHFFCVYLTFLYM